jgi:type VI secretion system protein ImpG
MDDLLPHYEQELNFLRRYSKEFALRYPKIASHLQMAGEVSEDPHIERMIQSFALLTARVSRRLDDDYPEFTEALLEVLYPHYLRPFPSCSIAHFDLTSAASQLTVASKIERGTQLNSRPIKGLACKFTTAYDVDLAPIKLLWAQFDPIVNAPDSITLPSGASAGISMQLEIANSQLSFAKLSLDKLRVFMHGEPSFCAAFRDALFMSTVRAYIEVAGSKNWMALDQVPLSLVGFDENEALIPFSPQSHPAYRLLTEYFAFPDKFNFFAIDIQSITKKLATNCSAFTLHLVLSDVRADSNLSRILSTLTADKLLLGCTPVVNLFEQRGEPIRLTQTTEAYPVLGDARRAHAYEVYSIDRVQMVRQTPQGERVTEFRPFYSLRHGETPEQSGHYWVMRRDDSTAIKSPGYETEISIVDIDFNAANIETDTLSLELTCTNREMPTFLGYGLPDGDLFIEGGSLVRKVNFLRKPTEPYRFDRGHGAHWRLISHLSLNHLSLTQGGIDAFRETLNLYDLPRSATSRRQLGGIVGMQSKPTTAWLPGNPFACLVRGVEVNITIDEESFVGSGIYGFATLIEHFLGLYAHVNSFVQLVIISERTNEELLRCKPRCGSLNLL